MTLRDLPHGLIKKLARDGEREFEDWWKRTKGKNFGSSEEFTPEQIFLYAFSRGATAVLLRFKEIRPHEPK